MLVLSRKSGESIVIPGCELTITVVAVKGNRVRLGFEAPAHVDIKREELLHQQWDTAEPPHTYTTSRRPR